MKAQFRALNADSLQEILRATPKEREKQKRTETNLPPSRLQRVLTCCKRPAKENQNDLASESAAAVDNSTPASKKLLCNDQSNAETKPTHNKLLEAGKKLPPFMTGYFPKNLHSVPIEELDEFYAGKKTMVVIGKDKTIFRFSATSAFWLMSPLNPIRRAAIYILSHPIFTTFILFAILANCVCMAMQNPPEQAEITFTVIYTFEALIKMLSRGMILDDFTYLRDAWNWLDVIVLTVAYVMFFDRSLGNVSGLRTLRVLRALKSVTAMPGLRIIIAALMEGVKRLRDAMILTFFVLSIFSLIGVQIYRGRLTSKCVKLPDDLPNDTDIKAWKLNFSLAFDWKNDSSNWQIAPDGVNFQVCSDSEHGGKCLQGYVCIPELHPNPNFGYTSYDNFGAALLCSFRLMTQDFWESLYQLTLRSTSIYHFTFFWFIIFLGSFYLINVILAIVAMAYADCQKADQEQADEMMRLVEEEQQKREAEADQILNEAANLVPEDSKDFDPLKLTGPAAGISLVVADVDADADGEAERVANNTDSEEFKSEDGDGYGDGDSICRRYGNRQKLLSGSGSGYLSQSHSQSRENNERVSTWDKSRSETELTGSVIDGKRLKVVASSRNLLTPTNEIDSSYLLSTADAYQTMRLIRSNSMGSINPDELEKMKMLLNSLQGNGSATGEETDEEEKVRKKRKVGDVIKGALKKYLCDSWSCPPCWRVFQKAIGFVILDPFVDLYITLCIVVNTLFLALDHYGMDENLLQVLKNGNYFFTATFAVECFAKIIALGPPIYFDDAWNVFDFVVVAFSLIELGLDSVEGLSVLRSFRLLRVFKLAKSWPTLNMLISIIFQTLGALGNLTFVLATIVFIFAVVGQQMFGSNYVKNCKVFHPDCTNETALNYMPRWNFYDFSHSFMIVFRVLCGEWIESMWDCMRVNDISCLPFFIATMVVGNLVVLKLFLALLLGAFGGDNMKKKDDDDSDANKLQEAIDRIRFAAAWIKVHSIRFCKRHVLPAFRTKKVKGEDFNLPSPLSMTASNNRLTLSAFKSESSANSLCVTEPLSNASRTELWCEAERKSSFSDKNRLNGPKFVTIVCNDVSDTDEALFGSEDVKQVSLAYEPEANEVELTYSNNPDECLPTFCTVPLSGFFNWLDATSCGRCWWKVRVAAYRIVEHKYFETFIILMIAISSASLTLEDIRLSERPTLDFMLKILDKTFNLIFFTEMILKWFAIGFKRYFADAWCWVDFICVAISMISMSAELFGDGTGSLGAFKAMRTLRALRPLRAVSRWEGMRVVVNALFQAIPAIANVMLVCLVFWLIFSIVGVQFFSGQFHRCVDENGVRFDISVVNNRSDCEKLMLNNSNITWFNPDINFDSVANAYLALFQIATFKGWMEIMADAVDVRGLNMQPSREHSLHFYIYFVMFIIFGSFFTLNLFIGVIIENFNAQKKKGGGTVDLFMTERQKRYYRAMKSLGSKTPQKPIPKPKCLIGIKMYELVHSQKFDIAIMGVILANTVAMCCEYEGMSREFESILERFNDFFVYVFLSEFVIKVIALRWHYLKNPWNVFDASVLALSLIGFFPQSQWLEEKLIISPTLVRIIRVFRVGRVLRLIKSAKGIRTLLFSLMVSLPALFNIGLLLVMVMFIYSIFGVNFFMRVKLQAGIDDVFNFQTFLNSFVLLFQISTSAGWNGVLIAITNTKDCDPNKDCGNKPVAIAFLVSYLIISFLVIVNMYIAVILENFGIATEDVQTGLTQDDFDMYYEKWEKFDPKATGYIPLEQAYEFLDELEEPLKLAKPNRLKLAVLNVPICTDDRINCLDLLDVLTRHVLKTDDEPNDKMPAQSFGDKVKKDYQVVSSTMVRQRELVAASVIIRAVRKFKALRAAALANQAASCVDQEHDQGLRTKLDGNEANNAITFVSESATSITSAPTNEFEVHFSQIDASIDDSCDY